MKNTVKKVFAVVLSAVLLLTCFAACGSSADPKVVKIGGIGPLTGAYANYGTSVRNGAQLAVDEINAAGGVNGMTFELMFEDSQGDPESAVNAYGKLMDKGMNVSIGTTLSGEMASVTAAAKADDMFLISASASADKCIEGNDNAFRVCFFDSYQGAAVAQYIKDNNMATEVGVLYESDYDYSVGLYNSFVEKAAELGITIKTTQTFTTTTATDFSTQIQALVDSGVKLVFTPIYAEEASTFLTQAKGKFADDVYFFGADGLDGILGKVAQDVTIADNVLMLTPFSANDTAANVSAFVSAYEKKFGATPDQFAAGAYDAVYIIKAALEKANVSDSTKITADVVKNAVLALTFKGVTGTMTWTEDGNTNKAAIAVVYKNGEGTIYGQ